MKKEQFSNDNEDAGSIELMILLLVVLTMYIAVWLCHLVYEAFCFPLKGWRSWKKEGLKLEKDRLW
ncbi:MAG: hypothetical protein WCV55_01630 [Candidatus Paceibacterota bacterium]